MHAIVRAAWISAAVIVAVLALGAGADRLTASSRVCMACHEMRPKVAAWETAAHTTVGCPACHEDPRPWYRFPVTLAVRGTMLARDVRAHFSSDNPDMEANDATSDIPDSRCLACHDPAREVTMRFGILIDHQEHADRNESCVSCHLWTAHPDPDAERPLLFMQQCFTCHGHSETAKAPGTCDVCHPPSFEQRPESHQPKTWQADHGQAALTDRQPCAMCHAETFCTDCHGLEMPHPEDWPDGEKSHGPVAQSDPQVCRSCHTDSLAFCEMCHHEGYDIKQGPWVAQHPSSVSERGASRCFDCHGALYCVYCHASRGVTEEPDSN